MKRFFLICLMAFIVAATMVWVPPARAGLCGWEEKAMKLIANDQYAEAEKLASQNRGERKTRSHIVTMVANAEHHEDVLNEPAEEKAEDTYVLLKKLVGIDDVDLLIALHDASGEFGKSLCTKLIDRALHNIKGPDDVLKLPALVEGMTENSKEDLYDGLGDWLKGEREKISGGGELPKDVRKAFSNPDLIKALARNVKGDDSVVGKVKKGIAGFPQRFKIAFSKVTHRESASSCLVLIEEPAIPIVEEMVKELGPAGKKVLEEIKIAKSKREIRNPGSKWYSGYSLEEE